ncbi:hypothetical protein [Alkalihalobacterium bogoriense]|uniref:hypothetical protein n=1 Tax=Alkalihalobacterium bogoriense TaxID=246272 RepID=UPI00047A7517|nr:hypothetical protein [Alkalihalobacterium bogoriense]
MVILIGYGKLATCLLQFKQPDVHVGLYSRNKEKLKKAVSHSKVLFEVSAKEFPKATHVWLTLPAEEYAPFFETYGHLFSEDCVFYYFATAMMKEDVQKLITYGRIVPCKFVGHADQSIKDNKAMLALEEDDKEEFKQVKQWFLRDMKLIKAAEEEVYYINKKVTELAIRFAVTVKKELQNEKENDEILQHSLEITSRGVIQSYINNTLGHFGNKIASEVEKEVRDEN